MSKAELEPASEKNLSTKEQSGAPSKQKDQALSKEVSAQSNAQPMKLIPFALKTTNQKKDEPG